MNSSTTTIDDQPQVWLPRLIAWAEREQRDLLELADDSRQKGHPKNAASLKAEAGKFVWVADWARTRLVDLSELSLADIDEPPSTLVAFSGWLRRFCGRLLPWVTAETWQTCAAMILADRERQRGVL